MKLIISIVSSILLFVCSCGRPAHVDAELKPYVDTFYQEAIARGVGRVFLVTVNLFLVEELPGKSSEGVVGRCYYGGLNGRDIRILKQTWTGFSNERKEALIMHELGHCALRLEHSKKMRSIMYPLLISGYTYKLYRTALLNELFDGQPPKTLVESDNGNFTPNYIVSSSGPPICSISAR